MLTVPSSFIGGISEPLHLLHVVVVSTPPGCILVHFPPPSLAGRGLPINLAGLVLDTNLKYVDLRSGNILARRDRIGGRQAHMMAKLISIIVHIVEAISYDGSVVRYWSSSVVTRKTEVITTLNCHQ